ncbi:hypothetical protein DFJ77DRAFT_66189 [Powellomyces hirtus]|nr:hypothetical protein DFJ77DRAFT_66189 [Powellomyces hirtus]
MRESSVTRPSPPHEVDMALLRLPDGHRGYRGIIVHDPRDDPHLGPQYRRPHRKALLITNSKRQKTGSEGTLTEASGEVRTHQNPVAAAIDQPYIRSSRRPTVRKPPPLPPGLESQKHEIKMLQEAFATVEREREAEKRIAETKFHLQFDDHVRSQVGEYRGHGIQALFEAPMALSKVGESLSKEMTKSIHKSQWLTMMPPKGTERPFPQAMARIRTQSASGRQGNEDGELLKTSTADSSHGVKALASTPGAAAAGEEAGKTDRTHTTPTTKENQRGSTPSGRPASLVTPDGNPDRRKSMGRTPKSGKASRQASIAKDSTAITPPTQPQTLSRSTIRFLKKLTREGLDPTHAVLTSNGIDSLLRTTLMGVNWTHTDEQHRSGSSRSTNRRATARLRRGYNPEEYKRAMRAGDDYKVPEQMHRVEDTHAGIHLVIPNVREMKDEDDTSAVGEEEEEENGSESRTKTLDAADPLADFSVKFLQILGKSKKAASQQATLPMPEPQPSAPEKFSMVRLVILLKRVATERYKPKYGLSAADEGKSAGTAAGHAITDFLHSPYAALQAAPAKGTPAHDALTKILMLGLCDESDDHTLRFESFKILTLIDPDPQLGRWEAIAFRKVVDEMLQEGNHGDRWLAATTLASQQEVNSAVLGILLQSLGEVDTNRRKHAIELIAGLDVLFADEVLEGILHGTSSTSWKVRQDSSILLERWIAKLAPLWTKESTRQTPPNGEATGPSSPSRSSTAATIPTHSRPVTQASSSVPAAAGTPPPSTPIPRLLHRSIETLLTMMWNDWSTEVRDTAAVSLGRLGKGPVIVDWIVTLLGSEDPLRRIDALRSLTRLVVLQPSAVDLYLKCLVDEFASVRVEACKLACIVRPSDRRILNALLDRFSDFFWQVRAYAVKAIGVLLNTDPQVHGALRCALYHDKHASVRAEAIEASLKLGILSHNKDLQEAVFTLLETDTSPAVRTQAEKALVAVGVIGASNPLTDSADTIRDRDASISAAAPATTPGSSTRPQHTMVPYPHLLTNRPAHEVEVFLRTSLVTEMELEAVMDQVREMAGQSQVMQEVAELDPGEDEDGLDMDRVDDHMPDVKSIHGKKPRKHVDVGLPDIVRRLPGVPYHRPWQASEVRTN